MKTPLLSLFVLFTFQTFINAQNWAPVGAKWTYTYTKFWSPEISYNIVESVGDTTINGKSCRILRSEKEACDMPWEDGNQVDFYMYDENDTVYYYNPDLNDFTILYDFNAQVGDEWITEMPQSQFNVADVPVFVRVDSVGIVAAAGMDLKIWHVTYYVNGGGFQNQYKSAIVEKWGDLQSFFTIRLI
ncbi:MAG: hypothetical protein D6714_06590 [Bacteroidetes bacterium]|nr:MAG: hypothetical protein D6714_06590 [Bacteroidota bacterium]